MKHRNRLALLLMFAIPALVWLNNTSMFSNRGGAPVVIAHRGLAPEMDPEHEDYKACTSRIRPAEHGFIENTIPSIRAAFDLGADFVEIDVRLTADDSFAVFHDDVLDCKTELSGRVVDYSMDDLRSLDVGYGYYTADGRKPLRNNGVGLLNSLDEVLDRFPASHFVINVKDDIGPKAALLAEYLSARVPDAASRLVVIGAEQTINAFRESSPSIRAASRKSVTRCIQRYMALGWTGYVPESCRNTAIGMYANYAWLLWGWPHRFVDRMDRAGTMVILTHPHQTESIHDRPETSEYAGMVPDGYRGAVVTNRIDKFRVWLANSD